MGRNKDSLIELAAKLTGENCGEVKTKKDALKKIACFYAGQEVECNTVADALQCIVSHCEGGGSGNKKKQLKIAITVGSNYYSTSVSPSDLEVGTSLYGGWTIDSIEGDLSDFIKEVSGSMAFKEDINFECDSPLVQITNNVYDLSIGCGVNDHDSLIGNQIHLTLTTEASGGSANLIDYTLSIPKISEALQNGNTEILPEDADGFKSIKLNNFRLNKLTVTANGTYSCGGYGSPYFYNEVEVNIEGSPYFEAKSVSPSSEPITLDLNGKVFGAITTFGANGNGYGAYIDPSVVSNSYSIDIMNGGSRAGTVNWNAEDKLLTYTPNPSYPMGSTNITFILF